MSDEMKTDKGPARERLDDGKIQLARYRLEHLDPVYEAIEESREALQAWMPVIGPDYGYEDARVFSAGRDQAWEKGETYNFVILDPGTGRVLGVCGLNQIDPINRRANLGYWVRTSATGRGVCPAAVRLLADFAFVDLGLERLEIVMAIENHRSRRVAEKAGAVFEGVLRARLRLGGVQHDANSYSIVKG